MKNMRNMGRKYIALFLVLVLLFSLNSLIVLADKGGQGFTITFYPGNFTPTGVSVEVGKRLEYLGGTWHVKEIDTNTKAVKLVSDQGNGQGIHNIKIPSPDKIWTGVPEGKIVVVTNDDAFEGNGAVGDTVKLKGPGRSATFNIVGNDSKMVTVTWKDGYNDESVIKTEEIPNDATIPESDYPENPTRDGYVFNGWGDPETDANGNGNITITAKWEKIPEKPSAAEINAMAGRLQIVCKDNENHDSEWELGYDPSWVDDSADVTLGEDGKWHWSLTVNVDEWVEYDSDWLKSNLDDIDYDHLKNAETVDPLVANFTYNEETKNWSMDSSPVIYIEGAKVTYRWLDAVGGKIIQEEELSRCLAAPTFDGELPEKDPSDGKVYEFDKWSDPEIEENEDGTITITYTPEFKDSTDPSDEPKEATYTVEWYDADGNSLKDETRTGAVGNEATVTEADKALEGYTFNTDDGRNVLNGEVKENGLILKLYFTKDSEPVTPPEDEDPTGPVVTLPATPGPGTPTPGPTPVTPAAPAVTPAIAPAAAPAAPAAAPTALVTPVADNAVPLANAELNDTDASPQVRELSDEQVPLASGSTASWALLNLILAVFTALISIVLLVGYISKKRNKEGIRVLSLVPSVVSIVVFILTENMSSPMVFVDKWTLWMVVFALANVVLTILSKKKRKDDDDNKQTPDYGIA